MKLINKLCISILTVAAIFVVSNASNTNTVSEESLGLRKTNLYTEDDSTKGDETKYSKKYAGSGYKIPRAFQDAPPMIPHDLEGMLPITINNNQCVSCHSPEVAKTMNATPYPISHMIDFRPKTGIAKDGRITKDGAAVTNTSSDKLSHVSIKSTAGKLSGSRFSCTQCHAPQSEGLAVENTFKPEFTSKEGASKSGWVGTKLMEGIDTSK